MRERPTHSYNSEPDDDETQQEAEGVSRREFLRRFGKIGSGVAAGSMLWDDDLWSYIFGEETGLRRNEGKSLSQERKEVAAGSLSGREVNGLYKLHLGLSTSLDFDNPMVVPENIAVDYTEQLGAMWKEKRIQNEHLTPVAAKTGRQLIQEYGSLTPTGVSLEMYSDEVDRVVADLHDRLDWNNVQQNYGLTDKGSRLLTEITNHIGGRELLSYALTELMPSADGSLNVEVLNFLLENAGREYVERIPAVYDKYTSFGPYQFTSYALFSTPEEKRGASHIAEHIADGEVPGSVSKLRGVNHHQVAYLLAVQNLANLIDRLPPDGLTVLQNNWQAEMSSIAQFIAAAHNYPYGTENSHGALKAGEYWIANDMKEEFVVSAGEKPRPYAEKTKANYESLEV